jgi:hypothetical protein
MINAVEFESGEDEAFIEPVLHVDLGEYILNANLLGSKEFCKIISRIDYNDDEIKSSLFDLFVKGDYDTYNVCK